MIGANKSDPNVPVEYIIKNPYPNTFDKDDPDAFNTSDLESIIDEHGAENVLLLAPSVNIKDSPIRMHVNNLLKIRHNGAQKYNFHVNEKLRGFEGKDDGELANKTRLWTYCGSKGCEADVVIIYAFDMYNPARPHSLNQIGVALSRARKRVVVIHSKTKVKNVKEFKAQPFYPLLGSLSSGMKQHIINLVDKDGMKPFNIGEIPPNKKTNNVNNIGSIQQRSEMTKRALSIFQKHGIISINDGSGYSSSLIEAFKSEDIVYTATDSFTFFSPKKERRFIQFGEWTNIASQDEIGKIKYESSVKFFKTKENVSALYGLAITFMIQNEVLGYVPDLETINSDGVIHLDPYKRYEEHDIRRRLQEKECEPLTENDTAALKKQFTCGGKVEGRHLVNFCNNQMKVTKKEQFENDVKIFPVKFREASSMTNKKRINPEQLKPFMAEIKEVYQLPGKTPSQWIYRGKYFVRVFIFTLLIKY